MIQPEHKGLRTMGDDVNLSTKVLESRTGGVNPSPSLKTPIPGTLMSESRRRWRSQLHLFWGFILLQHFSFSLSLSLFFFFCFLGLHPLYMKVPRLGVKLELQLLAYATATAMPDLSCICNLHHSSQQCQIPDPLSEAKDQTSILMDTSQILFCCATGGAPSSLFILLRPSEDWMMPTCIKKLDLYFTNSNANLFQKYPDRSAQK